MVSRFGLGWVLGSLLVGGVALADGDDMGARLTAPEGAPFPEARGEVALNSQWLIVTVEGLGAGEYPVLLDDGTGTLQPIGSIVVRADDEGDDDDDPDDGEGDDGEGAGKGEHPAHPVPSGVLKLGAGNLPFGATSPLELGGRAIQVQAADGVVVLEGTTPVRIRPEPEPRNGRCELSRPDPAVDEDAEGVLKLESGEGRIAVKVHLANLEPGAIYEVVLTNLDGSASEALGSVTINEGGQGQFKVDSAKGDPIPFGVGDLAALEGYGVQVTDPSGAAVLIGTVCPAQVRPGGGDHGDGDKACESRLSPPEGATDTDAKGKVELKVGEDGEELEVKVAYLEPGAAYSVALTDPAEGGATETIGQIVTNDEGAGKLEIDPAEGDAIPFGKASLAELAGFLVAVATVPADGAGDPVVVLVGAVPTIPCPDDEDDDDEDEDRCEAALAPPADAADADAAGKVELHLGEDGEELEVKVGNLDPDTAYAVTLTDPADAANIVDLGQIQTDAEGRGKLEVEPGEGDPRLAGAVGFLVAVKTVPAEGAGDPVVVLEGIVPPGDCPRGGDGHGPPDDHGRPGDDSQGDDGAEGEMPGGGAAISSASLDAMFVMVGMFDAPFLRGDANRDESVDLSDAVSTLVYLFIGGAQPYCLDASDANDDGVVDVADPIALLGYLFQGSNAPAAPGILISGSDPTADGLWCEETTAQ